MTELVACSSSMRSSLVFSEGLVANFGQSLILCLGIFLFIFIKFLKIALQLNKYFFTLSTHLFFLSFEMLN